MKKCYLLLCLMALMPLLLICNSVLADEQNSESNRSGNTEEAVAGTGSLIDAVPAGGATAEIVNQGLESYKDYREITQVDKELDEGVFKMADPEDRVDS